MVEAAGIGSTMQKDQSGRDVTDDRTGYIDPNDLQEHWGGLRLN
jgi:hypothetical protein